MKMKGELHPTRYYCKQEPLVRRTWALSCAYFLAYGSQGRIGGVRFSGEGGEGYSFRAVLFSW